MQRVKRWKNNFNIELKMMKHSDVFKIFLSGVILASLLPFYHIYFHTIFLYHYNILIYTYPLLFYITLSIPYISLLFLLPSLVHIIRTSELLKKRRIVGTLSIGTILNIYLPPLLYIGYWYLTISSIEIAFLISSLVLFKRSLNDLRNNPIQYSIVI